MPDVKGALTQPAGKSSVSLPDCVKIVEVVLNCRLGSSRQARL